MRQAHRALGALLLAACGSGEPKHSTPAETLLTAADQHHPTAAFSPDGKRIAYWAAGDTTWELRVAAADLSSPRIVATASDWFDPIIWSPDGQTIAFSSNAASFSDVWVVSPDSGAPRQVSHSQGVTFPLRWDSRQPRRLSFVASEAGGVLHSIAVDVGTGASHPMLSEPRGYYAYWSPDGKQIAYQLVDRSQTTLWLADSSGANPKQLTTEGLETFGGYPWSPDGTRLLYVSRRTGFGDIWSISLGDGKTRQLTHDIRTDGSPAWSPDGKWIAFISDRGRQTDVWVMPDTGGSERRVTDDEAEETNLQWVGGGTTLAFQTGRRTGTLSLISAADGSERPLTPDSIRLSTFDISPDGKEVVYGTERGGGVSEVVVQPMNGGAPRVLVPGPADNGDPYWSPDGKQVLFFSNRSGNGDLWVVNAEGGEPRALTNWPTDEVDGEWSADSKTVYFLSGRGGGSSFFDLYQVPAAGGEPKRLTATGSILNVEPSRGSSDVFVTGIGKTAGRFVLSRIKPDGSMQTLWDKSNVTGLSHRRISPSGDSLEVQVDEPGGGFSTIIVSLTGGAGKPILGKGEIGGAWSPDGKQLLYYFGSPNADLGVLNLGDGTTRRLTKTPEAEGSTQWTPDGKSVVVLRSYPRRRIATVDVAGLMK